MAGLDKIMGIWLEFPHVHFGYGGYAGTMKRIFLIATLVLAGCTTPRQAQLKCEQSTSGFVEMVDCLKSQHAENNGFGWDRDTDLISLYMAYADALSTKVQAGEIPEYEARINLAELYSRMIQISQERTAMGSANYANVMSGLAAFDEATQPEQRQGITCSQNGKFWNCW